MMSMWLIASYTYGFQFNGLTRKKQLAVVQFFFRMVWAADYKKEKKKFPVCDFLYGHSPYDG